MNLFITGGSGFISSHLKKRLALNGNFNVFAPKSSELNLTDESAVDDFVRAHKIDAIVHLANRGGGRDTLDMTNVTEYNLRIFFNIAKQKNKVAKIISFGSGAEYGKHKPIINAREDDYKKALPLDEYGFYKAITSHYIEDCADNIIQLRLFGIYGEMENYRYKFITNAVVKNLLHLPITINQNVFFDYMYVDDLLNVVEFYIENDVRHKIYNASSGTKIDLLSLAALVNEASDFKSEISVLNEGLNNEYTSDNSLLKSEMTPQELKQEILEKTKEYYRLVHEPVQHAKFEPGKSRVNYAGRVFDEHEMVNLVDSSLDFWLTYGAYSKKFEKEFAKMLGVKWAFLVNSGSSANLLAFFALTSPLLKERRIKKGDEVITVAAGFPTTVAPIVQYGAVPVFVDMELEYFNIDHTKLELALSQKTKAVMVAHTLGNPFNIKAVKEFCDKHDLWLIEDNCDALGSLYDGKAHGGI